MTATMERPAQPPRTSVLPPVPKRPVPNPHVVAVWGIMIMLLGGGAWSLWELEVTPANVFGHFDNAARFIERAFPLNWPPLSELLAMTAETLGIVFLATGFSVFVSTPIAIMAAASTTSGRFSWTVSRLVIIFCRAVPDLVFAIILFRLFGLGALTGILAMGISSIGMIGKLYADAIEELDRGPSEAVEAAGGGRWQWILSTVIPQLIPQMIATGLHRYDINLRTSVILGYVGVPGIGYYLSGALETMQWQRGMALALWVLMLCIVVELISMGIRAAIMSPSSGDRSFLGLIKAADRSGWATHEPVRTRSGAVRVSPPWTGARWMRFGGIGILVVLLVASLIASNIRWEQIPRGVERFIPTISEFIPGTQGRFVDYWLPALIETVQMGLAATLLGLVLALPVGAMAARNVAPTPTVALCFRIFIVVNRAIPELILAIVLLVILGFGPVPGVLALAFGTTGLFSKLFADSIEETDVRVQNALRAGGATRIQVFFGSTLRQVAPAMVAHIMYQVDNNVRNSTLLGIVGAGGIGYWLMQTQAQLAYDVLSFLILSVLLIVIVLEAIAVYIRNVIR
ncbi:phosphonate ABC transporter, permease protein PhnE [Nesterenkonia muleiensis]|uniref:phosphonate ABC transporter, permease protein PhnE n=1 Tax=Nesterenkonia muleiensis TaxID=2282648 RepID=UPI00192E4B54|nr:phosphonate ABC transporter, permease protein PhnE [Nesterenkonia muleiensis]